MTQTDGMTISYSPAAYTSGLSEFVRQKAFELSTPSSQNEVFTPATSISVDTSEIFSQNTKQNIQKNI